MLKHLRVRGGLKRELLLLFTLIIVGSIVSAIVACLHVSIRKLTRDEISMNAALTRQRFQSIHSEISQLENDIFSSYTNTSLEQLLLHPSDSENSRIRQLQIHEGVLQSFSEDRSALEDLSGAYQWSVRDGALIAECLLYQTSVVRPVGYLMAGIDPDFFERALRTDQIGYSALVNQDGAIFAASSEISRSVWEILLQETDAEAAQDIGKWVQADGETYYVQSCSMAGSSWRLICVLPQSHFTSQKEEMYRTGIWIALIAIGVSFFCSAAITNSLAQKVRLLVRRADDIGNGNFYNDIQLENCDELAALSVRLNTLGKQMDQLIQQSVEQEKRNGEIEYQCLELRYQTIQMQLNPHFIYNTLETINSLALLKNQTEISRLICRFAQMFRFSVQRANHDVSLAEEVDYIENYLAFYQLAYSNRVQYSVRLQEELKEIRLPSALLQPLVENALVHGVEESSRPVEIRVRCFARGRTLYVVVMDNGPGIQPQQLAEIQERLDSEGWEAAADTPGGHLSVGLYSVHRLIRLRFGAPYGVELESMPNIQTIAQITIPIDPKIE